MKALLIAAGLVALADVQAHPKPGETAESSALAKARLERIKPIMPAPSPSVPGR